MQNRIDTISRITQKKGYFAFLILAALLWFSSGAGAQQGPPMPPDVPEGVEFYENEGHGHIREGTRSFYKTDPPTSGPHDPRWLPPSVYEASETRPELLVHNLEHGNIVLYFDRSALSAEEVKWLKDLTHKYLGQWDGMLMVTRDDKEHPVIVTAWRAILRLKGLDKKKVLEFVDAFRGRGPENPVR
ncbi:MAG: DUF3105 domain-containing protein [Nitrospiria bacterium]